MSAGKVAAPLTDTDMARIHRRVTGASRFDSSAIELMREVERVVAEKLAPVATEQAQAVAMNRESLIDLIEDNLHAVYHCTRVWSAWGVGTMSEDDFHEARGTELAPDLADAIIAVLAASPEAAPAAMEGDWTVAAHMELVEDYATRHAEGEAWTGTRTAYAEHLAEGCNAVEASARKLAASQHGIGSYTHADVSDAHAKGYALGLSQLDRPHRAATPAAPSAEAKDERVAFEREMQVAGWSVGKRNADSGEYSSPAAQCAWVMWQARAALAQPTPVQQDAMEHVRGCFRAAEAEGLSEALAETDDERLKDLVERRLMHALDHLGEADDAGDRVACKTCNDNGMIGGPSFADPGEGGVPCPDCTWTPVTTEQHKKAFAAGDLMALAEEAGGARMAENVVQVTREDLERIVEFANDAAASEPVALDAINEWLAARLRAAGGAITDITAFGEECVRWAETQHGITFEEVDPIDAELKLPPAVEWPKTRDVGRIGDMSPDDTLRVSFDSDNDVSVGVYDERGSAVVEFCTPGSGGGKSSLTRRALIALMVAMEADNAADPSRDWWALRAQKGGAA